MLHLCCFAFEFYIAIIVRSLLALPRSQEMWETDLNAILIEPEAQHGTAGFRLLLV